VNPKNRNKIIILAVLGVAAAYFVLKPFITESDFDRQYRENQAKAPQQAAASGEATPAAGGAAAPAVKSQFQKASVNVDQLIDSIQEISFDYDTDRMQVNPMTPLVGPSAHQALATAPPTGEGPGTMFAGGNDSQTILRTFRVTGILWDKRDPMAVVSYPVKGQLSSEVITRGYSFPDLGIKVIDIEQERVILDANGTQVSLQLEER
jgi:hypothetical protein